MEAAAHFSRNARGSELLLEHCAAVGRLDPARPPVHDRLEALLGARLAWLLVTALGGYRERRGVRG